jgi:hypothetical protein
VLSSTWARPSPSAAMPSGYRGCAHAGGWFELGGRHLGYRAVEGLAKMISVLALLAFLRVNAYRARKGHYAASRALIFPVFTFIVFLTAAVDVSSAILLEVRREGVMGFPADRPQLCGWPYLPY